MRMRWGAAIVAVGILGFAAGFLTRPLASGKSEAELARLSTGDLASRLLDRAGRNFVADSRAQLPVEFGVSFYAQPKSLDHWLCRVVVVWVPAKIVRGKMLHPQQERWEDDITVRTLYGIWVRPTQAKLKAPDAERSRACANYRDFDNLITENTPGHAVRGTYLADVILEQVKAGKPGFPITCIEARESTQAHKACDARAVLAPLTLRDLSEVGTESGPATGPAAEHFDRLTFWTRGERGPHGTSIDLTVRSRQRPGKFEGNEAEVLSVNVMRIEY